MVSSAAQTSTLMAFFPTIPCKFVALQDCLSFVICYNINPNANFQSVNEPGYAYR
jgi:hypothetical protein